MPKQVQLRRGTTVQHAAFTGVVGEVTVDTTKKVAVVHDGSTVGGVPLSKEADITALMSTIAALTARVGAFGVVSKLSDGAIAAHTLVKFGSDVEHVAVVGPVFSGPALGVALNATTGAGQSVAVAVLSLAHEAPVQIVADSVILAGWLVEPSPSTPGQIRAFAGFTGSHLVVGVAMTESTAPGDIIDVALCNFLRIV